MFTKVIQTVCVAYNFAIYSIWVINTIQNFLDDLMANCNLVNCCCQKLILLCSNEEISMVTPLLK